LNINQIQNSTVTNGSLKTEHYISLAKTKYR